MSAYVWKSGTHIKANAQQAGEQFEMLEMSGGLTPEKVVEANRDDTACLHNEFEWDDVIAANEHRLNQARYLIRSIAFKVEKAEDEIAEPVRAYFKMGSVEEPAYYSTVKIMSDDDMRKELLQTALRELKAFEKKYQLLTELQPVFEAVRMIE